MAADLFDSFPDFPEQANFSTTSEPPTATASNAEVEPAEPTNEEQEEEEEEEDDEALFSVGPVPDHLVTQYFERRAIKIERETRQRDANEEKNESERYIAKLEALAVEARGRSSGTSWPTLPPDVMSLLDMDEHEPGDDESNIQLLEAEQMESASLLTGEIDEDVRREYQLLSVAARQDHDSSSSDSDFDGEFESYGFAEVSSSASSFACSSQPGHPDDSSTDDDAQPGYEPLNENGEFGRGSDDDDNNDSDDNDGFSGAQTSVNPDMAA